MIDTFPNIPYNIHTASICRIIDMGDEVMKRPSDELKEIIVERCLSGESITALENEYSISRGSIYNWLKKYKTQKKLRVNTGGGELRKLLCAKDHRLFVPCFDDLQQIVCIIRCQLEDKPFIEDQQINFPVRLDDLSEFSVRSCNGEFIKQLGKSYVAHRLVLAAGSISKSAGNICLAVT